MWWSRNVNPALNCVASGYCTATLQPKGKGRKSEKDGEGAQRKREPQEGKGKCGFQIQDSVGTSQGSLCSEDFLLHGCLIHPFSSLDVSFSVTLPADLPCSQSPSSPLCPLQLWVCGPVLIPRTKTDLGKMRLNQPVNRQLPYHIILALFPHQIPTTLPGHPCSAGSAHKAPRGTPVSCTEAKS